MNTKNLLGCPQGNPPTATLPRGQIFERNAMRFLQARQQALEEEARRTWGSFVRFPEANVMPACKADIATLTKAELAKINAATLAETQQIRAELTTAVVNQRLNFTKSPGMKDFFSTQDMGDFLTSVEVALARLNNPPSNDL